MESSGTKRYPERQRTSKYSSLEGFDGGRELEETPRGELTRQRQVMKHQSSMAEDTKQGKGCSKRRRGVEGEEEEKEDEGGEVEGGEEGEEEGGGSSGRRDYTVCPYSQLKENERELAALKEEVMAMPIPSRGDGGALLRSVGKRVQALSGIRDASFFSTLPPPSTRVILIRALCPLHEKTLEDGAITASGAATAAIATTLRASGIEAVFENTAMTCWRKGKDGVELKGGAAGCMDLTGDDLKVCCSVKDMRFRALEHAGVEVLGILALSNSASASLEGGDIDAPFFEVRLGGKADGVYSGIPRTSAPHPKYLTSAPVFTSAVGLRLGVMAGDRWNVPTAMLVGIAGFLAPLVGGRATQKFLYEAMRLVPKSRLLVRSWDLRNTTTTTKDMHDKLVEEDREKSSRGGEWFFPCVLLFCCLLHILKASLRLSFAPPTTHTPPPLTIAMLPL
jgi:hypothetical protein